MAHMQQMVHIRPQ